MFLFLVKRRGCILNMLYFDKINSSEKENRRNPPKSNCFENFKISLKFFFSENKFLEIKYIKQITNLKTTSI